MIKKFLSIATAVAALAAALFVAASPAGAAPGSVVARYTLRPGFYDLQAGLQAVWALNADEFHNGELYRIDPASGAKRLVTTVPFPAGGLAIAFGSLWVTDYFGNAVWRLAPDGHILAEIPVGLQPQWVHAAFGSLWVSNHHGASVSRVDPTTNAVIATVGAGAPDTFRSGPQDLTDDGTNLYVGSSNLQALQKVNPATNSVTTPATLDDGFCGPMAAIGGFVWSADRCTNAVYQLRTDGTVRRVLPSTGVPGGITTLGSQLWIGDDRSGDPQTGFGSDAVLEQRDPGSGALLRSIAVGGDATIVASGFGDLWVYDAVANTIRRVRV